MALTMSVVYQRESGILKRRRATPVPAAVLVLSRAVTVTLSAVAVVRADGDRGERRLRDRRASGRARAGAADRRGRLAVVRLLRLPRRLARDTLDSAQPVLQVVLLPLQMISGIYFAQSQLPEWLQHVGERVPARAPDGRAPARLAAHRGRRSPGTTWAIMALWGVAAALLAARRFRWLPER